jgi:hypothetical protein
VESTSEAWKKKGRRVGRMNAENTKALVESFPLLYCGADRPRPADSAPRFFFECRDGWFNLISQLSEKLERSARRCGAAPDSADWPRALQVKEKYGTLRFYVMPSTDEFSRLIDEAEKQSARTCELCGRPAKLREKGRWYKTFCDPCASESGYSEVRRP